MLLFFSTRQTAINKHNTRAIWIIEKSGDVGGDRKVWNQVRNVERKQDWKFKACDRVIASTVFMTLNRFLKSSQASDSHSFAAA